MSDQKIPERLQALRGRKAFTKDENRPAAVTKRYQKGYRTARENIGDLFDDNNFIEICIK